MKTNDRIIGYVVIMGAILTPLLDRLTAQSSAENKIAFSILCVAGAVIVLADSFKNGNGNHNPKPKDGET